jgi:HAD superfamily hydrolase (TIGR01484 family)
MRFPDKKLVLFDLDDTLAPSKGLISPIMRDALAQLLEYTHVGIITGGGWEQCKKQVIDNLPQSAKNNLHKFFVLPTCGTRLCTYKDGEWFEVYAELLHEEEIKKITCALTDAIDGMYDMSIIYGDIIENRGSQVTFSGLGQKAPIEVKVKFDPDQSLRKKIVEKIRRSIPEYEIRIGGATSIDITKKGLDKAYGIKKIRDHLGITLEEIGFVGDALFEGGNDYPALQLGLHCVQVKNPEDTHRHIMSWVN